jgi:hypothetical protein
MERPVNLDQIRAYLLGKTGSYDLCDAMMSVFMGDMTLGAAAQATGLHKGTISRRLAELKEDPIFGAMVKEAADGPKPETAHCS